MSRNNIQSQIKPLEGVIMDMPPFVATRRNSETLGLPQLSQLPSLPTVDDTDIGGPPACKEPQSGKNEAYSHLTADITSAMVDKDCMRDPLNDNFFDEIWTRIAENNTKIFRRVFRCNPDNEVTNWHEYTEFQAYSERFAQSQGTKSEGRQEQESHGKSGPPGATNPLAHVGVLGESLPHIVEKLEAELKTELPRGAVKEWADAADARNKAKKNENEAALEKGKGPELDEKSPASQTADPLSVDNTMPRIQASGTNVASPAARTASFSVPTVPSANGTADSTAPVNQNSVRARRRRAATKSKKGFSASDDILTREEAESLLDLVQGTLVVFPTEWLKSEEHNSNWLYQVDQVAPLQIYD